MIHRTTGSEHARVPLKFDSWRPAGAASSLVHSFYLFRYPDAGAAMPVSGLIVPDGQVEVGVVLSGAFFEWQGAAWTPLPAVYADRILTEATTIRCEAGSLLIAAKLKFGAAASVLGCPASALANREALADVVGPRVRPAVEAVRDAVRLREAVHAFEALLERSGRGCGRCGSGCRTRGSAARRCRSSNRRARDGNRDFLTRSRDALPPIARDVAQAFRPHSADPAAHHGAGPRAAPPPGGLLARGRVLRSVASGP